MDITFILKERFLSGGMDLKLCINLEYDYFLDHETNIFDKTQFFLVIELRLYSHGDQKHSSKMVTIETCYQIMDNYSSFESQPHLGFLNISVFYTLYYNLIYVPLFLRSKNYVPIFRYWIVILIPSILNY